jgi:hypothetical protein
MAFFETITVAAADAARSPDLLMRLRHRQINGIAR